MVRFQQSLVFKIGMVILTIQILGSSAVGYLNIQRFSQEVETRFLERLELISLLFQDETFDTQLISEIELLEQLIGEEIEESFIVSPEGEVFLYSYNQANLGQSIQDLELQGVNPNWFQNDLKRPLVKHLEQGQTNSLIAIIPIRDFNDQVRFFLFIQTSTQTITNQEQRITHLIVIGTLSTLLFIIIAYFISFSILIIRPIKALIYLMTQIQQGHLSVRTPVNRHKDEWHILQQGFNEMIGNLQLLVLELETRVTERTHALNVAFEVSQQVTTILRLEDLLPKLVELTRKTFLLDEVSIYLADSKVKQFVLQASTSTASHSIRYLNKPSDWPDGSIDKNEEQVPLRPIATESYPPILAISATQSVLQLPMRLGHDLLGILLLKSTQPDHFSQTTIDILQTLVNQITIAIRNAQLFQEAQLAAEDAEKANRLKSQFLAMMSHELRTPLNAVINFVEFVVRGILGPVNPRQQEALTTSVQSARHLLQLIDDILDISKIEAGQLNLFIQNNINLNDLFQEAKQVALILLRDKNVAFELDIAQELPLISGDRKRILQVILNMITNACKFTKSGHVTLKANKEAAYIIISVIDTGPGIAKEDFDLIFMPFKQASAGLQFGKGTGLGLPISKQLVESHGGEMFVESVIGEGTTFTVRLPCVATNKLT